MGFGDLDRVLEMTISCKSDNVMFCATGITDGDLDARRPLLRQPRAHALDPRALNGTVRFIESTHRLARARRRARCGANELEYDLVVVGAGSAGYAAALTARDLRLPASRLWIRTARRPVHSARLHAEQGLLASSDALHDVRESGALGVHVRDVNVDMAFIAERKRALVKEFADYRIEGIERFPVYKRARGVSVRATNLRVGDDVVLEAPQFIIATGSVVGAAGAARARGGGISG